MAELNIPLLKGGQEVVVQVMAYHLVKRPVTVGLQQDGFVQLREELQLGNLVATTGALFMSNVRTAASP